MRLSAEENDHFLLIFGLVEPSEVVDMGGDDSGVKSLGEGSWSGMYCA